jgi:hypothetical protein
MRASSIPWSLLLCMAAIGPVPGCGARSALTESFASGGGEGSEGGAGDGSRRQGDLAATERESTLQPED